METINNILEEVCNPSTDIDALISNLTTEYEQQKSAEELQLGAGFNDKQVLHGLLPSNTRIHPESFSMVSYSLDSDFIKEFVMFIQKLQIKNEKDLLLRLSRFCVKYFGICRSYDDRKNFLDSYEESARKSSENEDEYFAMLEAFKLSDLKGKNVALCTEYSSLTQQCLSLLGIKSSIVVGGMLRDKDIRDIEDIERNHAYNIVQIDNKNYIIDTVNPRIKYNKEGHKNGMRTTIVEVGDRFDSLKDGVSITHTNRQEQEDGSYIDCDEKIWTYVAGNSVIQKLNDYMNSEETIDDGMSQ